MVILGGAKGSATFNVSGADPDETGGRKMIIIVIKHCGKEVASVRGPSIVKAYDAAWKAIGTMSLQENFAFSCNHDWAIEEVAS